MSIYTAPATYTTDEIIELCGRHTLYEWGAQAAIRPVAIERAEGVYFWDTEGQRLNAFFRERGLYTMVRWDSVFICPPLCISAEQLREGLAIIDEGLERIDAEVRG